MNEIITLVTLNIFYNILIIQSHIRKYLSNKNLYNLKITNNYVNNVHLERKTIEKMSYRFTPND